MVKRTWKRNAASSYLDTRVPSKRVWRIPVIGNDLRDHARLLEKFHKIDFNYGRKLVPRRPNGLPDWSDEALDKFEHWATWNRWRRNYRGRPNLTNAAFGYGYHPAIGIDLSNCDLMGVEFVGGPIAGALLYGADLRGAQLQGTQIMDTILDRANLTGANLSRIHLLRCSLRNAIICDCEIYGLSAWDVDLTYAQQSNLRVTDPEGHTLVLDNIEIAQFIYMLRKSEKLRTVIDALATKMVLILGRFSSERKAILDSIRDALREQGYYPVLFDFEKPASRDLTETISTLAHLSRFIIVDLSSPRSVPHELASVVPDLAIPVQPIIIQTEEPYQMFEDFRKKYHWVLDTYRYFDLEDLLRNFMDHIVGPAEAKARELSER